MTRKHVEVAIAVVFDRDEQNVLICRRKHDAVLGGFWEFPGGKRDPGEALDHCARREVMEELGVAVAVLDRLAAIEYDYPHALVRLHPFVCRHVSGDPRPLAVAELRWVPADEVLAYDFPPANKELVRRVALGMQSLLDA